jgi:Leucine-rich repeat (LRR) protein
MILIFKSDLSGNLLTTLPERIFCENDSLEEIILSGNQISSLPEKVFYGASGLRFM